MPEEEKIIEVLPEQEELSVEEKKVSISTPQPPRVETFTLAEIDSQIERQNELISASEAEKGRLNILRESIVQAITI